MKQEIKVGLPSTVIVAAQERASPDLAKGIQPSRQAAAVVEALPDFGSALVGEGLGFGEPEFRGEFVVGIEGEVFFALRFRPTRPRRYI